MAELKKGNMQGIKHPSSKVDSDGKCPANADEILKLDRVSRPIHTDLAMVPIMLDSGDTVLE
jgi:hypothetical protein